MRTRVTDVNIGDKMSELLRKRRAYPWRPSVAGTVSSETDSQGFIDDLAFIAILKCLHPFISRSRYVLIHSVI